MDSDPDAFVHIWATFLNLGNKKEESDSCRPVSMKYANTVMYISSVIRPFTLLIGQFLP